MNGRLRFLGIGGAFLAITFIGLAFYSPSGNQASAQVNGQESPLVEAMETLNDGMRLLRRQARREAYDDETVEMVGRMLEAAVVALHEEPPYVGDVPEEERDDYLREYKRLSTKVIREVAEVNIAILEGRNEDVMDHLRALIDLEHEGHDKFDPAN